MDAGWCAGDAVAERLGRCHAGYSGNNSSRCERRIESEADVTDINKMTVHVRLGVDHNHRVLRFDKPLDIPTEALLQNGLAIDGGDILGEIGPWFEVDSCEECGAPRLIGFTTLPAQSADPGDIPLMRKSVPTLADALNASEAWLVEFLGEYGYEVEFE